MIDIVIPYTEGETKGAELRLCLEGIKRHMINAGNVFIVGDQPSFAGYYIHMQETDRGRGKQDNIRLKILAACSHPQISDPFLFMNDDYFLLRQMDAQSVPYLYNKTMLKAYHDKRKIGSYKQALQNTVDFLGGDALHYDIHYPIIYRKENFTQSMELADWCNWSKRDGFVIKSLYCAMCGIKGQQIDDPKLKEIVLMPNEVHQRVKDWPMFSTDENTFNQAVIDYLTSINICV